MCHSFYFTVIKDQLVTLDCDSVGQYVYLLSHYNVIQGYRSHLGQKNMFFLIGILIGI